MRTLYSVAEPSINIGNFDDQLQLVERPASTKLNPLSLVKRSSLTGRHAIRPWSPPGTTRHRQPALRHAVARNRTIATRPIRSGAPLA
jgi:hypothetical protein